VVCSVQLGMAGLNVLLIRAGWGDELPEEKESMELSHVPSNKQPWQQR